MALGQRAYRHVPIRLAVTSTQQVITPTSIH